MSAIYQWLSVTMFATKSRADMIKEVDRRLKTKEVEAAWKPAPEPGRR